MGSLAVFFALEQAGAIWAAAATGASSLMLTASGAGGCGPGKART